MGKKTYMKLIGIFALLAASIALLGCTGPQPGPNAIGCGADLYTCQDGTKVARDYGNNCQFSKCPVICGTDLYTCQTGDRISRVARDPANNCEFPACQPVPVCTQEAKLCYDGSYVSRNSNRNCAFDACPVVVIPTPVTPGLAPVGADCAGTDAIRCQTGLQCIISGQPGAIGTCTEIAPPTQSLKQCPSERYGACTAEFAPVCGKGTDDRATFRDYTNACVACSTESNAIGYYAGTCENQ